jgi:hypothetical protein
MLYDPAKDTYAGLLQRIAALNKQTFTEVGIVFDGGSDKHIDFTFLNDKQPVPSLVGAVQVADPQLETWSAFIDFLNTLKTTYSMQTLDFLGCYLYCDPNWQYVFNTITAKLGILIQASTDETGNPSNENTFIGNVTSGANWIMESNGVNIKDTYFNSNIINYPYTFFGATAANIWIKNGDPFFTTNSMFNCYLPTGITATSIGSITPPGYPHSLYYVIGSNNILYGFLFNGSVLNYYFAPISNVPTSNGVPKTPLKIRCGWGFLMVLFTDGTMCGIGRNNTYDAPNYGGQLGDGTVNDSADYLTFTSTQAILPANTGIVDFDCAQEVVLVIYKDLNGINRITGFGHSWSQILSFPDSTGDYYPTNVSAGGQNAMIIYENASGSKKLYMGGANNYGQMGITGLFPNTWENVIKDATSLVPTGITIAGVLCGGASNFILSTTGIFYGIGMNADGNGNMGIDPAYNAYPGLITSFTQIPMSLPSPAIGFVSTRSSIMILCANNSLYGNYGFLGAEWWGSWQVTQIVGPSEDSWIFYAGALSAVVPPSPPDAPTNLVATSNSISFTEGNTNNGAITNYQYSLDAGATWTELSPKQKTSPITLPGTNKINPLTGVAYGSKGLTHNTAHSVRLQAINSAGSSPSSAAVNVSVIVNTPSGNVTLTRNGYVLSVTNNLSDPYGNVGALTYYWTQTQNGTSNATTIVGETSNTYTYNNSQAGYTINAVATYTDHFNYVKSIPSNGFVLAAGSISGALQDGYVAGSTVTIRDLSGNVLAGPVTSDSDGNYSIPYSLITNSVYVINCSGGTDLATNLPLAYPLTAIIANSSANSVNQTNVIVNPLTTIVSNIASSAIAAGNPAVNPSSYISSAATTVSTALGISSSDINVDYLATQNVNAGIAAVKLVTITAVIAGATSFTPAQIAQSVTNAVANASGTLAINSTFVNSVITNATSNATSPPTVSSTLLSNISGLVTSVSNSLDQLQNPGSFTSGTQKLTSLYQVSVGAQNVVTENASSLSSTPISASSFRSLLSTAAYAATVGVVSTAPILSNVCFAKDTKISTDQGEIEIQDITSDNTIDTIEIRMVTKTQNIDDYMVLIKQDAFAQNVPCADTYVSGEHMVQSRDNILEKSKTLINGDTVVIMPMKNQTVYNILFNNVTDNKPIVANNMIAESLDPNSPFVELLMQLNEPEMTQMDKEEHIYQMNKMMRLTHEQTMV